MNTRNMNNDEAAQVGIGTMIVFIATILVAAVAAGVLIDTSQKLQAKSTQTGEEATANVGTSIVVQSAVGGRATTSGNLEYVDLFISLAPGAEPVDLKTMIIQYNDGTNFHVLDHATSISDKTDFTVTEIRDEDNSIDAAAGTPVWVMTTGDLVKVTFGATGASTDIDLGNSVKVDINLVPKTGSEVSLGFTSPASYGQDKQVDLF